jgi:hypothetical protein
MPAREKDRMAPNLSMIVYKVCWGQRCEEMSAVVYREGGGREGKAYVFENAEGPLYGWLVRIQCRPDHSVENKLWALWQTEQNDQSVERFRSPCAVPILINEGTYV